MILRDLAVRLGQLSPADRKRAEALLARPADPFDATTNPDGWGTPEAATSPECGPDICVHWTDTGSNAPALADNDANGFPVARITYAPGNHELTAQRFYIQELTKLMKASGADVTAAVPNTSSDEFPVAQGDVPGGAHLMGGMAMGKDRKRFVCDGHGRVHELDNVFVCDGSVFVTSGAMNPTLTIMATALRNARHFA